MYIKASKYALASFLAGALTHYAAHGYLHVENIITDHATATIQGVKTDIASAWGYVPWSPPPPPAPRVEDPDSLPIRELLLRAAEKQKLNPALVLAVARTESAFNPEAQSPAGAIGLMQVMPANYKRCGLPHRAKLWNERINAECGAKILREELATYKGNLINALKAYNGGPQCVRARCQESEQYVIRVLTTLGAEVPTTFD